MKGKNIMINMFKNYAKLMGRITHTAVGVNGIKKRYTEVVNIVQFLAKDEDGQFRLRSGAFSRLKDLYHNEPNDEGHKNFVRIMHAHCISPSEVDKSYKVCKLTAQISFLIAISMASFAAIDIFNYSAVQMRDICAVVVMAITSIIWWKFSLGAYQNRTYNKCTPKQWIQSEPQWWSEAFKTKERFGPLSIVMYPNLLAHQEIEVSSTNNRIAY